MSAPLLSVCIPSYNRPIELRRLLESIDCNPGDIEIVISEDMAPKREEVRNVVKSFLAFTGYIVNYYENPSNIGYDSNLRQLVEYAKGDFVLFMGDDDLFVPNALNQFIEFLKQNYTKSYVLRTYLTEHPSGHTEYFRYLPQSQVLSAGEVTVAWLFKRSVSLCGFTIRREKARLLATNDLDGTLLYQVYLMAQICLREDSVYCDIPITNAVQTFRGDSPMFGNSEKEKSRFTPGVVSQDNSINFTKAYFEVTEYLDKQHGTKLTTLVRTDLSKYSYPILSIQRKRGLHPFIQYAKRLEIEVGLGCTSFFYIYKWALIILGERICDRSILLIKRVLGYTPNF